MYAQWTVTFNNVSTGPQDIESVCEQVEKFGIRGTQGRQKPEVSSHVGGVWTFANEMCIQLIVAIL